MSSNNVIHCFCICSKMNCAQQIKLFPLLERSLTFQRREATLNYYLMQSTSQRFPFIFLPSSGNVQLWSFENFRVQNPILPCRLEPLNGILQLYANSPETCVLQSNARKATDICSFRSLPVMYTWFMYAFMRL